MMMYQLQVCLPHQITINSKLKRMWKEMFRFLYRKLQKTSVNVATSNHNQNGTPPPNTQPKC